MEKEKATTGKYVRLIRLAHLFKKIFLWSIALFVLNFILKKTGWETWDKFNVSVEKLSNEMIDKMKVISPFTLYYSLKTTENIYIKDTTKTNQAPFAVTNPLVKALKQQNQGISKYKNSYEYSNREMTVYEKLQRWSRGFWYTEDLQSKLVASPINANWFGRSILLIALCGATWKTATKLKGNYFTARLAFIALGLLILNLLKIFVYLYFFSFILYGLLSLFLAIGDALAGIFAYIMGLGGLARFFIEELKSEAVDHTKQSFPLAVFSFLPKKK